MSIHSGPGGLAGFGKAMEKRFAQVGITAEAVHRVLWEGGEEDHQAYTSGTISTRQLRSMGHPFAREGKAARNAIQGKRRGSVQRTIKKGRRVNGLPINKPTGRLQRSFESIQTNDRDKTVKMFFKAPYAKYVLSPTGTSKMIARGFYTSGGKMGIIRKRHGLRKAVAKKIYRQSIKKV